MRMLEGERPGIRSPSIRAFSTESDIREKHGESASFDERHGDKYTTSDQMDSGIEDHPKWNETRMLGDARNLENARKLSDIILETNRDDYTTFDTFNDKSQTSNSNPSPQTNHNETKSRSPPSHSHHPLAAATNARRMDGEATKDSTTYYSSASTDFARVAETNLNDMLSKRRKNRRIRIEGRSSTVLVVDDNSNKDEKGTKPKTRKKSNRKAKPRKKLKPASIEEEEQEDDEMMAKRMKDFKRVAPVFLEASGASKEPLSISRTQHLIIVLRVASLIRFGFEDEDHGVKVASELFKLKRAEEKMFKAMSLSSLHVPKTVEGLLCLAGFPEPVVERYVRLPKSTKATWTLENILNAETTRGVHQIKQKKVAAKSEKTANLNSEAEDKKEDKEDSKILYLEDFKERMRLTERRWQSLRLAVEQARHRLTPKKAKYIYASHKTLFQYKKFLSLLQHNKESFFRFLKQELKLKMSQRDLTFFDLFWQYLPVSEWYEHIVVHGHHHQEKIDAAREIVAALKYHSRNLLSSSTSSDTTHSPTHTTGDLKASASTGGSSGERAKVDTTAEIQLMQFLKVLRSSQKADKDQKQQPGDLRYEKLKSEELRRLLLARGLKVVKPGKSKTGKRKQLNVSESIKRLRMYDQGKATQSLFKSEDGYLCYQQSAASPSNDKKIPQITGKDSVLFYCSNKMPNVKHIVEEKYSELDPDMILQAWHANPSSTCHQFARALVAFTHPVKLAMVIECLEKYHAGQYDEDVFESKFTKVLTKNRGIAENANKIGESKKLDPRAFVPLMKGFYPSITPADIIGIHRDLFLGRYTAAFSPDYNSETSSRTTNSSDSNGVSSSNNSTNSTNIPDLGASLPSSPLSSLEDDPSAPAEIQTAARFAVSFDPMEELTMAVRESIPVEKKVLIRNIDPNLTPLDVAHGFSHMGRLVGVELLREHLADSLPPMGLEKYLSVIEGKDFIKAKIKVYSEIYGWLYFEDEAGAQRALCGDLTMFGVLIRPTNVVFKKVDPNRFKLPGIFRSRPDSIACAIQTTPAKEIKGLFVGNLPLTSRPITEAYIQRILASEGLDTCFQMDLSVPENQGYAGIIFDTHHNATIAHRILTSGQVMIEDRHIQATWVGV